MRGRSAGGHVLSSCTGVWNVHCHVHIWTCPVPAARCLPVQLSMLVLNGVQPNELVVKRLAMLGCTGGCCDG